MAVKIAPLRLQDSDAAVCLWRGSGLINKVGKREERRAFVRQLKANRGMYLGAYDGKRLVGTVLGTRDTRKGRINHLAVDPSFQRRGVGTRLLRTCERALAQKGIRILASWRRTRRRRTSSAGMGTNLRRRRSTRGRGSNRTSRGR